MNELKIGDRVQITRAPGVGEVGTIVEIVEPYSCGIVSAPKSYKVNLLRWSKTTAKNGLKKVD
ncbi:hypothetical protein C4565_00460 [Candidatus Parcubacteria bacterium]|nr:MAG: hypothetical protein C4565_00460 [Candidatus Parcubacteria bacterium]